MSVENPNEGVVDTTESTAETAAGTSTITEPTAEPSIKDIMQFDPFAPPKGPKEEGSTGSTGSKPAEDKKVAGAPGTAAQKLDATSGKPIAQAAPAATPVMQPLSGKTAEQLMAEHTAAIRQSLEARTQPASTDAQRMEQPKFNLGIPPQLVDAMASEDPKERMQATHALINGVANAVWREADQMVKNSIAELSQGLPRVIEAHMTARNQQQEIYNDFYGKYEMFKSPDFVPLVQATGMQLVQEAQARGEQINGWTPALRDAIAERLFTKFPMLKPTGKPAAPAKPKPFSTGSGTRPAAPAGVDGEMMAVLGKTG